MMKETIKSYLAGILDADGYFTIKRSTYHMRVVGDAGNPVFSERVGLKQVTPEAVELLHKCFGGSRRIEKPSAKNGKPLYAWHVSDKQAYQLAITLLPYLLIKKRQAQIVIKLRESKSVARVKTGETFVMHHRSGKIFNMPKKRVDPIEIQKRERLFIEIKSLNDTRPHQSRLIGKG